MHDALIPIWYVSYVKSDISIVGRVSIYIGKDEHTMKVDALNVITEHLEKRTRSTIVTSWSLAYMPDISESLDLSEELSNLRETNESNKGG